MTTLNQAIADELKRVLKDHHLSVSGAARILGVSRQTLHSYLSGASVPRRRVLAKAAELWHIRIVVGEVAFDGSAFQASAAERRQPEQLELNLWKKLDAIRQDDLHISLEREGKTLKVAVSIDIPA